MVYIYAVILMCVSVCVRDCVYVEISTVQRYCLLSVYFHKMIFNMYTL